MDIKKFAKKFALENPKKITPLLHLYNKSLGGNHIRIKKGNGLAIQAAKLHKTRSTVHGINNRIFIDDYCRLSNCAIHITGNNNTITLSRMASFLNTEFYIENDNNEIRIGVHTTVSGQTHFAAIEGTRIIIGDDCLFSKDIHFRTGDSHGIHDLCGRRVNVSEDIVLGNHVWVGTKVICLKGVSIPGNCVIGAGSLLSMPVFPRNWLNPASVGRVSADTSRTGPRAMHPRPQEMEARRRRAKCLDAAPRGG